MASATTELLESARVAARAASQLLAGARASDIRAKGNPRDLVTEWDLRSEEIIRTTLAERTPGIPLLAEEGGQTGAVTGRSLRWVVDPIDGTVNFAHGFPIWSVSIALEDEDRKPIVGVVTAPALGWWFEAAKGGGAHDGEGRPLVVSTPATLEQALLTTGFPYDRATNPDNNFVQRSEERRVGKECRSRWSPYH